MLQLTALAETRWMMNLLLSESSSLLPNRVLDERPCFRLGRAYVADVSYAFPLYTLHDYFRCTMYAQVCTVLVFGASYMFYCECVS